MNLPRLRSRRAPAAIGILLAAVGVGVLLVGGYLAPRPASAPIPTSSGRPAVLVPPASDSSASAKSGASGLPSVAPSPSPVVASRLTVPDLGINLAVYEGDGSTATLGKAAHYPGTSWPGGGTLIYLYAHARDGMFIALWKAQLGQHILLSLVDGSTATYSISKIDPIVQWNDTSVLLPTDTELLRLQTCTSYGPTAPRFIVEAVPVASSSSSAGASPAP